MKPTYNSLEHLLVAVAYGLRSLEVESLPGTPPAKVLLSAQVLEPEHLGALLFRLAIYSSVPVVDEEHTWSLDDDWILDCIETARLFLPRASLGLAAKHSKFKLLDIVHQESRKISRWSSVWTREILKKHFVYENVPVCSRIDPLILRNFDSVEQGLSLGRAVYREYFDVIPNMCTRLVADIQQHPFLVISQRDPGAFADAA